MASGKISKKLCENGLHHRPAKIENTHVFLGELGVGVLQIWKLNLNVPPPLSPPSLIQISWSGMAPLCHVKWCTLLKILSKILILIVLTRMCMYTLSLCHRSVPENVQSFAAGLVHTQELLA